MSDTDETKNKNQTNQQPTVGGLPRPLTPNNIAVIYAPATVSRPRAFSTSILQLTQFGQPAPSSRFLFLKHFNYTYSSTSSYPCHTSLPWLHHVHETLIDCVTDEGLAGLKYEPSVDYDNPIRADYFLTTITLSFGTAHTERGLWCADSRLKIPSYFQERFSVSLQEKAMKSKLDRLIHKYKIYHIRDTQLVVVERCLKRPVATKTAQKHIPFLRHSVSNATCSTPSTKADAASAFYGEVYTADPTDHSTIDDFLHNVPEHVYLN
ncbi:hypothetical protein J3Q64DRAFT_1842851 [Phycomyces blakesleeanus]|uniref:Uncharacterized protein n=1 Tax=Phycomyces blakesleeanus TaxID=4837 RepID=A0ABR3AHM4_PHYBL